MQETDNHLLNTYNTGEINWTHSPDMEHIEELLPVRDVESNLSNYTAHDGAIFIATDTGAVYDGDGSNWNKAERDVDQVTSNVYRTPSTRSTRETVLGDMRQLNNPAQSQSASDITPTLAWHLDDGRDTVYEERDIWSTVGLTPGIGPTTDVIGNSTKMTWEEIEELAHDLGWEVFNHGKTGSEFGTLTKDQIETEVFDSTSELLDHGINPEFITYPGGDEGGSVGKSVSSQLYSHGFKSRAAGVGLTSTGSTSYTGNDPMEVNRAVVDDTDESVIEGYIDEAVAAGTSLVLVSHDIITGSRVDEGTLETSRGKIQNIVNYATNNGMETGTTKDILRQQPQWQINVPDAGHIRPVKLSGIMAMYSDTRFEFLNGPVRFPNITDNSGGTREVWYDDGSGSNFEGMYVGESGGDTGLVSSGQGAYDIQKDGTDGTGVINFKTQ